MIFSPTILPGSYIVSLEPFIDDRGWFARYYCKEEFQQVGHTKEWVQMNHSVTNKKGTVRGMHFQTGSNKEIKLVRCIAGAVFDVIVDLRKDSETFLQWFGTELSSNNRKMLYIPEGFAHGFQSLSDNAELLYHHTAFYSLGSEAGLRIDDPLVGIKWPLPVILLSGRDKEHPYLEKTFKGL